MLECAKHFSGQHRPSVPILIEKSFLWLNTLRSRYRDTTQRAKPVLLHIIYSHNTGRKFQLKQSVLEQTLGFLDFSQDDNWVLFRRWKAFFLPDPIHEDVLSCFLAFWSADQFQQSALFLHHIVHLVEPWENSTTCTELIKGGPRVILMFVFESLLRCLICRWYNFDQSRHLSSRYSPWKKFSLEQ